MKYLNKIIFGVVCLAVFLTACDKKDVITTYPNGTAVTLTPSTTTVAAAASDSNNVVLTLKWTNPKYGTDSAHQKFVFEVDTAADFLHEQIITVNGPLSLSFTGSQLDSLLARLGLPVSKATTLQTRVTSSYANNNELYHSNVVPITVTPFIIPIVLTPSTTNPLVLNLTGAADTVLSFNLTASQYGADAITYGLQFDTVGGNFANPQVIQYANALKAGISGFTLNLDLINAGVTPLSSKNVEFRVVGYLGANYTNPSVFSNTVNINITTFIPTLYLYVPGQYQGWNGASPPVIAATTPNINSYEGYIYVSNTESSTEFIFSAGLNFASPNYHDAGNSTSSNDTSGGSFTADPSKSAKSNRPQNTFTTGGEVYLTANTSTFVWSAIMTTWAVIGDATPGGWSNDTQLTYDQVNNVWYINGITLTAGGHALKFRANGNWNDPHFPGTQSNLGGDLSNLSYGGGNISIATAGTYNIVLNLSTPLKYTATITLQ